jgi:cation diffusion facilitator family transporter
MPATQNRRAADRDAARIARWGIVAGVVLGAVKIGAGLAFHSVATVSDGLESAADVLASSIVALGLWAAAKPADAEHPYGHGRYETLTGLGVGTLLVGAGVGIFLRALEGRFDLHQPSILVVWPLLASIAVKAVLSVAKMRAGRRASSDALTADAWHEAVDMLSDAVALTAVSLSVYSPEWSGADHYGGSVIGVIVVVLGVLTVHKTALNLLDTMPAPARVEEIRAGALQVPGALGVEKCFARKTGLRYHVDLHLEVDPDLTVFASHEIASAVRDHLKANLDWVEDVLVHVEPHLSVPAGRAAQSVSKS